MRAAGIVLIVAVLAVGCWRQAPPAAGPTAAPAATKAAAKKFATKKEFDDAVMGKRTDEVVELIGSPDESSNISASGQTLPYFSWIYYKIAIGDKTVSVLLKVMDGRVAEVSD